MAGYWTGRASRDNSEDSEDRQDAVALIDRAGDAQLMLLSSRDDRQFVLFGNVCCDEEFDDDVAGRRFRDDRNEAASVRIERSGDSLQGEVEFRDHRYTLQLSAAPDYEQAVTLPELAGTYTRSRFFLATLSLTIESDGRLTGSDSNGCILNGTVAVADQGRNMMRLRVDMDSCGDGRGSSQDWNGSYTGLGLLLHEDGDDVFFHSMIGPTWLGPQSVER
jgi:hypothetical protein